MSWNGWRLWGYSSLAGWVCLLTFLGYAEAQGESPRPSRRVGGPGPGVSTPVATPRAPQPLAPNAKIILDQNGLSVDVQEQDLSSVVERIASLGQFELRHPEGMPNRRVSTRFSALPVVEGLKRLFRVAEVPGYVLVTADYDESKVQRIVFLTEEGGAVGLRGASRQPAVAAVIPPRPGVAPPAPGGVAPPPVPPPPQTEEVRSTEGNSSGSVFDDIKSNAAARRLLSQMMHPNEQVRERAFEGLVRLFREDEKQRALMEFLEPIMEDLIAEDKATQDEAREEIRKLLSR